MNSKIKHIIINCILIVLNKEMKAIKIKFKYQMTDINYSKNKYFLYKKKMKN